MRVLMLAAAAALAATGVALSSEKLGYRIGDDQSVVLDGHWFECMTAHVGGDLRRVISGAVADRAELACKAMKDVAINYKVENLGTPYDVARFDTGYIFYRVAKIR